jgi:hypothetical protein
MDQALAHPWILYLNPDEHINEFKLVKNAALDSFILLQDIRNWPGGPKPEWLEVMPVLLDTSKRLAYRGLSCLPQLVSIELPPEHAKRLNKKKIKIFD